MLSITMALCQTGSSRGSVLGSLYTKFYDAYTLLWGNYRQLTKMTISIESAKVYQS